MKKIGWEIKLGNYKLGLLESVSIERSVEMLSDTAKIQLPGQAYGKALEVENRLKKGDPVIIKLGYGAVKTEFEGYINSIYIDKAGITINCEDAIYLSRKPMDNAQLKNVSVLDLLNLVAKVMGNGIEASTTYSRKWDKFIMDNTNGYEVLKKIQEECRLYVYVADGGKLVAEPIDTYNSNKKVVYDFAKNIEIEDLKYRRADDKEYEVVVEGIDKNGKRETVVIGKQGGEKRKIIISAWKDKSDLKKRGEEEMKFLAYDGYEGSITTWLCPYVRPGYAAEIKDDDYEYKTGSYFITAVTTELSASGGVRKVKLGRKLS